VIWRRVVTAAIPALAAASFGLLIAAPLNAQVLPGSAQNERCYACHGPAAQKATIDVNGSTKSIYVDKATYAASLHGELDCTSCHVGFKPDKHGVSETIGWLETAKLAACGNCHAGEFAMYQGSFHGTLVLTKDFSRAPLCADCHEAHNIVNVNSLAFRKSTLALCTRCHRPREQTYLDGYHGKAFLLGRTEDAVCIDCHGGHRILAPSDPASTVSKQNLLVTCRRCHPGVSANFTGYRIHVDYANPHSSFIVFMFWLAYIVLITVVFTFGAVHMGGFIYRGIKSGGYRRRQPGGGLERE
jgi:predicted CXXCH cytochrome family protein